MSSTSPFSTDFFYKYSSLSVDRLEELQAFIDGLKREGRLSDDETFRSYLKDLRFEVPEGFPEAKSIIVMAFFNRLMLVDFHLDGEKHEVMLPPQYYASGLTEERLEDIIREEIIREPGYRIERTTGVHLKLLAVRSGLGKYGRNNISYVDGMGSLLKLFAYFTDYPFEDPLPHPVHTRRELRDRRGQMRHAVQRDQGRVPRMDPSRRAQLADGLHELPDALSSQQRGHRVDGKARGHHRRGDRQDTGRDAGRRAAGHPVKEAQELPTHAIEGVLPNLHEKSESPPESGE
jgi:hypothetical protein